MTGQSHDQGDVMDVKDIVPRVAYPELVFGLVGSIGTDLEMVTRVLDEALKRVSYNCVPIKLTQSLKEVENTTGINFKLQEDPLEERYNSYINAGNTLCREMNSFEAFGLLSVAKISDVRKTLPGDGDGPRSKVAYVIKQFKRPQEIEFMRRVYGRGFFQISAYCSKDRRAAQLTSKIAESHFRKKRDEAYRGAAFQLIVRDEDEEEEKFGQRVRDTFALADVVVDATSEATAHEGLERFIRAIFGDNFVTPKRCEVGMYLARVASLQTADLSRQVGAVIASEAGDVISTGCNEVPAPGGGVYWEGDPHDHRDFQLGYDSNKRFENHILRDLFRRLKVDWLNEKRTKQQVDDLVRDALKPNVKGSLSGSYLTNIIEYGRIVHAEMNALATAARLGRSVQGAILYTTTFPCHICARHIIAAGIKKVIYLEPYSKSLAQELYDDSISLEDEGGADKIPFVQFVGIAPERYYETFRKKNKRKDADGRAAKWNPLTATPMLERLYEAYLHMEEKARSALGGELNRLRKKYRSQKSKRSSAVRATSNKVSTPGSAKRRTARDGRRASARRR